MASLRLTIEEFFVFLTFGNICVTVHGVQHRVALPVINAIPWRRTPLSWEAARAQAAAFFNERYTSRTPSSSSIEVFELDITSSALPCLVPLTA